MDCYILAMQELLAKGKLSEDEFAFLTNYSITNAWIDTEASSTFEVPVIFPEWFPNDDDIRELCPALCKETFRDFSTYLSFIKRKIEEGGALLPHSTGIILITLRLGAIWVRIMSLLRQLLILGSDISTSLIRRCMNYHLKFLRKQLRNLNIPMSIWDTRFSTLRQRILL
ncbi:hypothetical protein GA0061078_0105 [Bifidobacterium bohemicum]|uniref:hypothetical protein n=1 Tax=Bifidobacterium bohemicum TaxID=638617 RepID=UPI0005298D8F|nr:hypothetical protein [Bifidobacterium bohemicum]SCC20420.1 hypothetical protein GA0061078_0105 [Bifidobacterium bohemicum]